MAPAVEEIMRLIQQQLDDASRLEALEREKAAQSEALQAKLGDHYQRLLRQQVKQQIAMRAPGPQTRSLSSSWGLASGGKRVSPERHRSSGRALASPISRAGYESSFTTMSSTLAYSPSLIPTPGVSEEVFNSTLYASAVAGRRSERKQHAAEPLPTPAAARVTASPPVVTHEQVLRTFESVCVTKEQQAQRSQTYQPRQSQPHTLHPSQQQQRAPGQQLARTQPKSSSPPRSVVSRASSGHAKSPPRVRQGVKSPKTRQRTHTPSTPDTITQNVLRQHARKVASLRASTCAAIAAAISSTHLAPPSIHRHDRVVVKSGVYKGHEAVVQDFENGFVLLKGLGKGLVMEHPENMVKEPGSRTPSPQKAVAYTEWKPAPVPQDIDISSPVQDEDLEETLEADPEDYKHFREEGFSTMFNGANATPPYAALNVTPTSTPPRPSVNPPPKQPRMNKSAIMRIEAANTKTAHRSRSTPKRYYTSKEMTAYANTSPTPKKHEEKKELVRNESVVSEPQSLGFIERTQPAILPLGRFRRTPPRRKPTTPKGTPDVVVAEAYSPESVKNAADEWEGEVGRDVLVTPQPLPTPVQEKGLGTLLDTDPTTMPVGTFDKPSWSPPKLPNLSPGQTRSHMHTSNYPSLPAPAFTLRPSHPHCVDYDDDDDDYAGDALSDEEVVPPRLAETLCKRESIQRKLYETEEACGRALCKEAEAADMEALFGKMQERLSLFRTETEVRRRVDRERVTGLEELRLQLAEQQRVFAVPIQEEANRLKIERIEASAMSHLSVLNRQGSPKRANGRHSNAVPAQPAHVPHARKQPPKHTHQPQRSVLQTDSVPYHPLVAEHQAQFLIIEEQAARHALRREQQEARTDLRKLKETDVSAALDLQLRREESVTQQQQQRRSLTAGPSPAFVAQRERQEAIREKAKAEKEAALQANYYPLLNKRALRDPALPNPRHSHKSRPVPSGPVAVRSEVGMVSSYENEAVYRDVEMNSFLVPGHNTPALVPEHATSSDTSTPGTLSHFASPSPRGASLQPSVRQSVRPQQPPAQLHLRSASPAHRGIGLDMFLSSDIAEYDDTDDVLGTIVAPSPQGGRLSNFSSALLTTSPPDKPLRSSMFGPGEEGVLASLLDRENASLRNELARLQSENAMKDRQISTLRATSSGSRSPPRDREHRSPTQSPEAAKLETAAARRRQEEESQRERDLQATEKKKADIKAAAKREQDAKAARQREAEEAKKREIEQKQKAEAKKKEEAAKKREAETTAKEKTKKQEAVKRAAEQQQNDEKQEKEREEAERKRKKAETVRKETEQKEAERKEAERLEKQQAAEAEAEKVKEEEAERKAAELKAERQEEEQRQAGLEAERKKAEREEAERKETEREEAERKETLKGAERKETERKEAERKEAERKETEREEAERKETLKEAERKEATRKEAERKEAERRAAECKEAEREEAEEKARYTPSAASTVSTVDSTINKRAWYAKWSNSKKKYYFVKGNTTAWEVPPGMGAELPCSGGTYDGRVVEVGLLRPKPVSEPQPVPAEALPPKVQPKRGSFMEVKTAEVKEAKDVTPPKQQAKPVDPKSVARSSSSSSSSSEVVRPVRRMVSISSSDSDDSSSDSSSTADFREIE